MKNLPQKIEQLLGLPFTSRPNRPRCKHIAGIYYGNQLISVGRNQKKSHPLQARYSDREQRIYLHAEIDAIANFFRAGYSTRMLENCDLVVLRLDGDGILAPSKPCLGCQRAISAFNIREVAWS